MGDPTPDSLDDSGDREDDSQAPLRSQFNRGLTMNSQKSDVVDLTQSQLFSSTPETLDHFSQDASVWPNALLPEASVWPANPCFQQPFHDLAVSSTFFGPPVFQMGSIAN